MSAGDGIRWGVKNNAQPAGALQSAPPARELSEVRARAYTEHATKLPDGAIVRVTELNPHRIYAPKGDPLVGHRPRVVLIDEHAIEDLRLKGIVIRVIVYLGVGASIAWGLYFWAVSI
jgi:hypothetical protein